MIHIDLKTTDERQGIVHASGTIGGHWMFRREGKELLSTRLELKTTRHRFVASFDTVWKSTIPAGCPSDNGGRVMKLIKERLIEVYGEG